MMLHKLLAPDTIRDRPEIVQSVRAMIEGNEVSGIAGDLMAMAERPDSTSLLADIRCPAQIIVGELDHATPPADARLMADRIPGAGLAIIPGAAHLSNLEKPDEFNEIVDRFASRLTASGSAVG
jgi:3-oxoadipate enol-lactonase